MPDTPQQARKNTAGDAGQVGKLPGASEGWRPQNNLPLQLTGLVGREREISEVEALLADNRLLTLTGPGGSGKTRLALAVGSGSGDEYEDGVWLIELAPLSDAELVPQAVASALGVREEPGVPLLRTLEEHLRPKSVLLVLDNCEHLVGACVDLTGALLRSCPGLRVLATSREALGVTGETLFVVPPLSLPDPRHLQNVECLTRYEAAGLFAERARAVRPSFGITERNAFAVAQICYRLDGMPLAIELAAARARALSVEQIAERLDDRFALLTGGERTAMPHHGTLRATMDWSYELLSDEERALLGRLSVFAGGFTLEAAEAVGMGEGIPEGEVLDPLTSLVDKSLVMVDEHGDGSRYRMLETVRQYGREKLREAGEESEAGGRHAEFFLRLAEEAEPELKGREQVEWLGLLELDHDNLRAAMRFMLDHRETETAVQLAWALWLFWYLHGHQGEGYRYAGELLEEGEDLLALARAKALFVRAIMSHELEGIEQMRRLLEASVALFRRAGNDKFGLAQALGGAGVAELQQGDAGRAAAAFEEALKLYREVGDKVGASAMLTHLGMIPFGRDDHEQATRYFEEALATSREIGDRLSGYVSLHSLALSAQARGDHERARKLYLEGLTLAAEVGDKAYVAYCLEGLAGLTSARDEPSRATRLLGASEALLESVGAPHYVQAQARLLYEHAVESLRSRLGEEAFVAAWAEGRQMTPEQAIDYALEKPGPPEDVEPPDAHPAGLSAREVEVLRLVARGITNARIAQELFISPRTVNGHLTSAYKKTGSAGRAEAARFATEHGLL